MVTNLPNYYRNFTHNFDTEPVKNSYILVHITLSLVNILHVLLDSLSNYVTHLMPHIDYYITTSHCLVNDYCVILNHSISALCKLRDEVFCGNDVVLLLDEMHLQQQVQFDGRDLIGCNENLEMFKSILCFMVVSLKNQFPISLKRYQLSRYQNRSYVTEYSIVSRF